jgi:hypothetical protein
MKIGTNSQMSAKQTALLIRENNRYMEFVNTIKLLAVVTSPDQYRDVYAIFMRA